MRVKITALTESPATIPFNYNFALHSAIYGLIEKSSGEYSRYLHDKGFINETVKKRFKLFTFSKLFFTPTRIQKNGFHQVKEISFIFSTPIEQSYEHLILGLFSDQTFHLNFSGEKINFSVTRVEAMPEPQFNNECKFLCLSPIAVSTQREKANGRLEQHYLDYMNPEEREHFIENIKKNLINKYQTFYKTDYADHDHEFKFSFDVNYITKRQGKISKLIHFKKIDKNTKTKIKGFEAPFKIIADTELIKIGYEAGFGNGGSMGLGCVALITNAYNNKND
ncbi:MAG: CRISPR-associated endoribonuclease Cas6 [Thermodesulfobacteriota bacterium]|nr:CRISPR-associated endoribonuclease Cas6 [Thermodesulfobacteriota bacterium]